MPITGTTVAPGGIVVLYTEENYSAEYVEVPEMRGYTLDDANYIMTSYGLNFIAKGATTDNSGSVVQSQSEPTGTRVPRGTVVELTFGVDDQSG